MELQFVKVNPTANMTILVETPVPRHLHAAVAEALMAYEGVYSEQVGFLEPAVLPGARARLQMMGGEFCGNASMSLAAMLARDAGISQPGEIPLEVSGANGLVRVRISPEGAGFRCGVDMPLPDFVGKREFPVDSAKIALPYVRFPGISFAIVPIPMADAEAARLIASWHHSVGGDAFGILLWDEKKSAMRPLVRVQGTNSAVWERGCGSGTSALGAYMACREKKSVCAEIAQPGGTIGVRGTFSGGALSALSIVGTVLPVCKGVAWIDVT